MTWTLFRLLSVNFRAAQQQDTQSQIHTCLCGQTIKTMWFLKKTQTILNNNPRGELTKVINYLLWRLFSFVQLYSCDPLWTQLHSCLNFFHPSLKIWSIFSGYYIIHDKTKLPLLLKACRWHVHTIISVPCSIHWLFPELLLPGYTFSTAHKQFSAAYINTE